MDISALTGPDMTQTSLAVAKKVLDNERTQGQAVVQLIQAAGKVQEQQQARSSDNRLDVYG
jgi:hypothetical protein